MKKTLPLYLFFFTLTLFSQRNYNKEISFINDNDLYISLVQDRYYTNGMFFSYRYLGKYSSEKVTKRIYQIQLGHQMYTPYVVAVPDVSLHDRPFAGYVYGSFGFENFYKNNSILKLNGKLGWIGPAALGKQIMDFTHRIYDFEDAIGWKYQIKNAIGLNVEFNYIKPLTKNKLNSFDVAWYTNAKIGTIFTEITTGFYTRIGFISLQNFANSIAFGGNLNSTFTGYNKAEAFFYFKPLVSYAFYDATIQGSFLNKNSPITFPIKRVRFTGEFGLRFTLNRFNFGYAAIFHSKKLKSSNVPSINFYGKITLAYQFK